MKQKINSIKIMYQFSGRLKSIAIICIIVGALGMGYGFYSGSSKTLNDAKELIAHQDTHYEDTTITHSEIATHGEASTSHNVEHVLEQLHNRPWAALFVALFFFFMIALLIFVFYTVQIAASAGWSIVLFRVMEGLSASIVPLGVLMFVFLLASSLDFNRLYVWMHAEGDALIEAKRWWLNIPGWLIRSAIYIGGFILFRWIIRKMSLRQDDAKDMKAHKTGFNFSILFIVFFMLAVVALAWDWIMSLDPHWFSSLFGWYVFASTFVSAITVIALATIYLKSKGYLEFVNDSHLHDLGKYMFAFSIFWAYLFFSQYMLIWYANMPEETTYFAQRMQEYKLIFLSMVVLNFVFPLLLLMDTAWKRSYIFVSIVGIIILMGHFIDIFIMIMPATVGAQWGFGIPEISAVLFFLGIFLFFGFKAISRQPLLAKGNPYLEESKRYHY